MDNIDLAKSFAKNSSKNVSYFGSMSNYISVKKDIQSVNIFNSPDDFLISDSSFTDGHFSLPIALRSPASNLSNCLRMRKWFCHGTKSCRMA
jgi:hypothetical protein